MDQWMDGWRKEAWMDGGKMDERRKDGWKDG